MITTRFMSRLFSATEEGDEELTAQVAQDIQDAQKNGAVDTDEVRYENNGDGSVSVIDKDNGEVTVAEQAEDGNFDLYAMPTGNLEQYVHPEVDGVTPGYQQGAADENAWEHLETGVISPNVPGYGLNPEAGYERTVEETAFAPCEDGECGEREFSVATSNDAVLKIFSDQEFCERVFSEVLESEETANVGDLKVEKIDDDTVVVTSKATGDQAKVTLSEDEMQVDELSTKDGGDERSFSEEEQYEQLHVVGVDPVNHVIVDAPEYDGESAQELVEQLLADGVAGVQVFDNPDDARDYAMDLMGSLGAESEADVEEPVEATFSDHTVYFTKFYSARTNYMERLFSEAECGIETSQNEIEDAIENGEEIENDDEIITPVDSETAVVEDKKTGEFTKVTIDGDELDCTEISKAEAEELVEDLQVEDENAEDEDEEEREYSDYLDDLYLAENYYSDYEDEYFDDERYFSELSDEDLEDLEYRLFSEVDEEIYSNDEQTKFFSESEAEYMTSYQQRLFSGEADEAEIEKAIEEGKQIENDTEVITPVDDETAIIEDKETGEFTKAVLDDETIDVTPISESEADELTDGLEVSEDEDDEEEKEFSWNDAEEIEFPGNPVMEKFFAEMGAPVDPAQGGEVMPLFDAQGNPAPIGMDAQGNPVPVEDPNAAQGQDPNVGAPSVEQIEDSADQAINMIQQAAQEAANQILQAKQAPVQGQEQDLQEAQFSDVECLDCEVIDVDGNPLISWLNGSKF